MNYYKKLNKQRFSFGKYSLVPIRFEDRSIIMKWRNEQIYHLRQNNPLTEEDQENYFSNVVSELFDQEQPSQMLFSYLESDICIGYGGLVHINWIDKNAEISFVIDTALEKKYFKRHWGVFLDLLEQIAFDELHLHKIFTYAFDLRPHLYEAIEAKNYKKEAILKEHCFFNDSYKDICIHSKINNQITLRMMKNKDVKLIFNWANDPQARDNSFSSSPIEWTTHLNWFNQKIDDPHALYLICEMSSKPIGLVRFDKNDGETVVGVLIDPKFRGRGLGAILIQKGCDMFFTLRGGEITAYIKKNNVTSLKAFARAGFLFYDEIKINDIDSMVYKFSVND